MEFPYKTIDFNHSETMPDERKDASSEAEAELQGVME